MRVDSPGPQNETAAGSERWPRFGATRPSGSAVHNDRCQVTDTGRVRQLLDDAAEAWPHLAGDRKALLLRLAERGGRDLASAEATALDLELREQVGRWVAIRGSRLLHVADDPGDVARWLRSRGERADQLFRVPASDTDIAAEHGLA